jgi:hypothetical protein
VSVTYSNQCSLIVCFQEILQYGCNLCLSLGVYRQLKGSSRLSLREWRSNYIQEYVKKFW